MPTHLQYFWFYGSRIPDRFTDFRLVQVLSFSFTDQNTVLTSSNANIIVSIAGDGFGNISQWILDIGEETGPVQLETIYFMAGSTDSSGARLKGLSLSQESLECGHRALWRLRSRPC